MLFASVAGLCLLGLPIVLSASAPGAILSGGSPWSYVIRQCVYMVIGVVGAVVASRVPTAVVRKLRFVAALRRARAARRGVRARTSAIMPVARADGSGSVRSRSSPPS